MDEDDRGDFWAVWYIVDHVGLREVRHSVVEVVEYCLDLIGRSVEVS